MSGLKAEIDPAEVGLDARRLQRIDRHFARYADDGRLPGWLVAVSRRGRLAHVSCYGSRDLEAGLPVEPDTLWRIYSMTKPVTSVAAMILYEEGAFELNDPVSKFIPAFAGARVYTGGPDQRQVTVPATEPVRSRVVCSEGELSWGGAASTAFWVDQREELAVAFYTQLLPSSTYRIRPQLRQLVYQALTS
jgi:CubicO group peptidase (beta-lactamase class C family)